MQLKICTIDRQILQELSIFLTLVFIICSLFFHYHFLLTTCHVTSKSMNLYISFLSKNYLTSLSDFPVRVQPTHTHTSVLCLNVHISPLNIFVDTFTINDIKRLESSYTHLQGCQVFLLDSIFYRLRIVSKSKIENQK